MNLLPFSWHFSEFVVIVGAGVALQFTGLSTKQRKQSIGALLALLIVTVWPVGDLAASVSLTVATIQRLVIMLLVAPLLLLSLPTSLLVTMTKPRIVDAVLRRLTHPGVAIVTVLVLGTATLSVPVVDAGAHSQLTRELILLVVLLTGFLLWMPALNVLPGAKRLSPAGRGGYLFGSSLVVTSLSFIWIFSLHPLYSGLHHQKQLVHMSALFDQQMAGFVAKGLCYFPLWIVAFVIFSRAEESGVPVEESPLYWADVERQLLRIDRQRERAVRRHKPQ